MVRAGVVRAPQQWPWCGYHEIVAARRRYRVIDREALAEALALDDCSSLASVYGDRIGYMLEHQEKVREPQWTEAVAVGDAAFVQKVQRALLSIRATWQMVASGARDGATLLREASAPYSVDFSVQTGPLSIEFSHI